MHIVGAQISSGAAVPSINIETDIRVPKGTRKILVERVLRDRCSPNFGPTPESGREVASEIYLNAQSLLNDASKESEIVIRLADETGARARREKSTDDYLDMLAERFNSVVDDPYESAIEQRKEGNLVTAKALFNQAAQKEMRRDNPNIQILCEAGNLHLKLGAITSAIDILSHGLQASSYEQNYSSGLFIETHANLASAKLSMGDVFDARLLLLAALEACRKSEFQDGPIEVSLLLLLAQAALKASDIDAVEDLIRQERKIRERIASATFQSSQLLNDEAFVLGELALGPLRQANKDITEIYEQHLHALSLRKETCIPGAPAISESHINLAVLLTEAGQVDQAIHHITEARSAAREVAFNDEHPIFIFIDYCFATLWIRQGELTKARTHADTALSLARVFLPERHPQRIQVERLYREIVQYNTH